MHFYDFFFCVRGALFHSVKTHWIFLIIANLFDITSHYSFVFVPGTKGILD